MVADGWMSSEHARIRKIYGAWVLEDAGSKNGSLVNGHAVERNVLADGDVVELGHTFLLYRESARAGAAAPAIVGADELRPAAAGLATLVPLLAEQFRRIEAIAASGIPVVVEGETGTGKELVASAIHLLSGRRGPFVPVDCGAFSPAHIQSGLFGYAKDAFPGAGEGKTGIIQSADGGTLPRRDRRPAAGVAAAPAPPAPGGRDLRALAAGERFRSDLLARLSGLELVLPPLRERLLLAALGLLALVVGAGALWWRGRSPAAPQPGPASGRTSDSGQPTASP